LTAQPHPAKALRAYREYTDGIDTNTTGADRPPGSSPAFYGRDQNGGKGFWWLAVASVLEAFLAAKKFKAPCGDRRDRRST
jgi:hypothetical protein